MGFEPMTNGLRVRDSDQTELLGYIAGFKLPYKLHISLGAQFVTFVLNEVVIARRVELRFND